MTSPNDPLESALNELKAALGLTEAGPEFAMLSAAVRIRRLMAERDAAVTALERVCDALFGKVMNVPCEPPKWMDERQKMAYQLGHRDARHLAAAQVCFKETPL